MTAKIRKKWSFMNWQLSAAREWADQSKSVISSMVLIKKNWTFISIRRNVRVAKSTFRWNELMNSKSVWMPGISGWATVIWKSKADYEIIYYSFSVRWCRKIIFFNANSRCKATFHRVMIRVHPKWKNRNNFFSGILHSTPLLMKRESDGIENKLNSINFILLSLRKITQQRQADMLRGGN